MGLSNKSNCKIYVGIDPGVNTGVAVWNPTTKKFDQMLTLDFWQTLSFIEKNNHKDVFFVLENPDLIKPMYGKKSSIQKKEVRDAINQRIGKNKAMALLYLEYLEIQGANYISIKPVSKKKNKSVFQKITGYSQRTNQHVRDAGMLVYERR